MRTVIAGVVALLVVAGVAFGAWQLLAPRLEEPSGDDAETALVAFADALAAGDDLTPLVWSDPDDLVTARGALAETVDAMDLDITVGAVEEIANGAARGQFDVTVTGSVLPTALSWQSEATIERRRGRWRVVADVSSLHPELRPGWGFALEQDTAARAPIVDHTGVPLTGSGPVHVIGIEPRRIRNEERLRTTWADELPESLQELIDLLNRRDLQPTWFYPVTTISGDRYAEVSRRLVNVPGVIAREDAGEIRAESSFARHVLGRVGSPTREMIDEGADPEATVGLYGLERLFEETLTGEAPLRLVIVEADGDVHAVVGAASADPPTPVTTTLDANVQSAIENALEAVSEPTAIVAIDIETGGIRGTASRPVAGYNRAWEGQYAPGDALLPMAVQAIRAGGTGIDTPVDCPAEATVAGARLSAPRGLDTIPADQAFGAGCDTTVGLLAADLEEGQLSAAAERLGFGLDYDLPLPAMGGSFPEPIDRTERVRAATGQSRVLASPLHLAAQLTGLDGTWNQPSLLPEEDGEGGVTLPSGDASYLERVLRAGVTAEGSAVDLRGLAYAVAGTSVHSTGEGVATHGWALGTDEDLRIAFVVLTESTGSPDEAVRLAGSFLREWEALS